jgi:hypothetical protein
MSIQLQGNNDSSFSNDINIKGIVQGSGFRTDENNGQITANYNLVTESTDQALGLFIGCSDSLNATKENSKATIAGDGSASFAGGIDDVQYVSATRSVTNDNMVIGVFGNDNGVKCVIKGDSVRLGTSLNNLNESSNNQNITLNASGSASFSGNLSFPNAFLALDTGGTLDVKERLQNTRAILLRLKAALIQPDADVNTLRARLLEAFDILTLEGDEE